MRLRGSWYEGTASQAFLRLLTNSGYKAFFVGGCVRDDLLGETIGDIDISTSAGPPRVLELAKAQGFKTVQMGIRFGTVAVVAGNALFEVTSFRRDVSTDGRHASVAYHDNLPEDAQRRDFTMNALYADYQGQVIDPIGGLPDLEARRVRFVGDPRARIAEDYLRMLRFFRISAQFGDPNKGLDPDGLEAIKEMAARVGNLSRERIGQEVLGLMAAPDPSECVQKMVESGIWSLLLPDGETKFLRKLAEIERQHGVFPRRGCSNSAIRRLATIGNTEFARKLRFSRKQERRWRNLRLAIDSRFGAAALAHELGASEATDAVLVRAAVNGFAIEPNFESEISRGSTEVFPVRPRDLLPDLQGAALGAALRRMKKAWFASGLALNRAELLEMKNA